MQHWLRGLVLAQQRGAKGPARASGCGARPKAPLKAGTSWRRVAFERAALLLSAVAGILACGGDEPDVREFRDVGLFSLESSDGRQLTFSVLTGAQCLSACDENVVSCSARLEGSRIELHTLLQITQLPGVEVCSSVCVSASGSCTLDIPSPGSYRFAFASRADRATVPLEGSIPLFDDDASPEPR